MQLLKTNYMRSARNPGWVELFFDLAFVVLLGRMAHLLFEVPFTGMTALSFVWIFSIQLFVWMIYTVYMNIYGNDSQGQNLFTFVLMLCLLASALLMHNVEHNAKFLAVSLGVMSLIIAGMYFKVRNVVPQNQKYAAYKSKALLTLGLSSMLTLLMTPKAVMIFSMVIYTTEHFLDEVMLRRFGCAAPDGEHFVERIGIFMILLLGESFITVVDNFPETMTLVSMYPALVMFALIFGVWINYFTFVNELAEAHYDRYSQVLFTNWIVMIALTVLPAIIYHGIHQSLDLNSFKVLVAVFGILFFGGNSMSHFRLTGHASFNSLLYGMVSMVLILGTLILSHSYTMALTGFLAVFILATVGVLASYRKHS